MVRQSGSGRGAVFCVGTPARFAFAIIASGFGNKLHVSEWPEVLNAIEIADVLKVMFGSPKTNGDSLLLFYNRACPTSGSRDVA